MQFMYADFATSSVELESLTPSNDQRRMGSIICANLVAALNRCSVTSQGLSGFEIEHLINQVSFPGGELNRCPVSRKEQCTVNGDGIVCHPVTLCSKPVDINYFAVGY